MRCPFPACGAKLDPVRELAAPGDQTPTLLTFPVHELKPDSWYGTCPGSQVVMARDGSPARHDTEARMDAELRRWAKVSSTRIVAKRSPSGFMGPNPSGPLGDGHRPRRPRRDSFYERPTEEAEAGAVPVPQTAAGVPLKGRSAVTDARSGLREALAIATTNTADAQGVAAVAVARTADDLLPIVLALKERLASAELSTLAAMADVPDLPASAQNALWTLRKAKGAAADLVMSAELSRVRAAAVMNALTDAQVHLNTYRATL